jgi:hypothetical protein
VNWHPKHSELGPTAAADSHALTADEIKELTEWGSEPHRMRQPRRIMRHLSRLKALQVIALSVATLVVSTATPPVETHGVVAQASTASAPAWLAFQEIAPVILISNPPFGDMATAQSATTSVTPPFAVLTSTAIRLGDAMPVSTEATVSSPQTAASTHGSSDTTQAQKSSPSRTTGNPSTAQTSPTLLGLLGTIFSGKSAPNAAMASSSGAGALAQARNVPMAGAAAIGQSIANTIGQMNQAATGQRKS